MNQAEIDGYTAGWGTAHACSSELLASPLSEMSTLAGEKLEASRKKSKNPESRNDLWATGFFEGFLEYAELLVRRGQEL